MGIWKRHPSLEELNKASENCLNAHVEIKVIEIGEDFIVGTMPVDHRTKQPYGLLHGGASVVLAESIGSIAGNLAVEETQYCVGLEINANHLAKATEGFVTGVAKAIHIGRNTQVWEIRIHREDKKPVCISRLTLAVLDYNKS
ncbi:MAG: hotdog fold thioesterase [Methyloligellaceae bacterium]